MGIEKKQFSNDSNSNLEMTEIVGQEQIFDQMSYLYFLIKKKELVYFC